MKGDLTMAMKNVTDDMLPKTAKKVMDEKESNKFWEYKLPSGIKELDSYQYGGELAGSSFHQTVAGTGLGKTTINLQKIALNVGHPYFVPQLDEKTGKPVVDGSGKPIGEWKEHTAIIFAGESAARKMKENLLYLMAGRHNVQREYSGGREYYYIPEYIKKRIEDYTRDDIIFDEAKSWSVIKENAIFYAEHGATIFLFDNQMTLTGAPMNADPLYAGLSQNQRETELASFLEDLSIKYNVWVELISHVKKESAFKSTQETDKSAGSSNVPNSACTVYEYGRVPGDQGEHSVLRKIKILKHREFKTHFEGFNVTYDPASRRTASIDDMAFFDKKFAWEIAWEKDMAKIAKEPATPISNDEFYRMAEEAAEIFEK